MVYSLRFAAHSEVGRIPKNNQDSGYASPTLLVVTDGMGGVAGASAIGAATDGGAATNADANADANGDGSEEVGDD